MLPLRWTGKCLSREESRDLGEQRMHNKGHNHRAESPVVMCSPVVSLVVGVTSVERCYFSLLTGMQHGVTFFC